MTGIIPNLLAYSELIIVMDNLFASLAYGTSLNANARRKRKSSHGVLNRNSDGGPSRPTTVQQTEKKAGEIRSSRKKGRGPKQGALSQKNRNLRLFADTTTQQKKKSVEVLPSDSSSDSEEAEENKHEDATAVAAFRKRLGIKGSSAT